MKSGLKRGNWYSVRPFIQTDLQKKLKRKEIVKSLKTDKSKQARLLLAQHVSRAEDLFFRMRAGVLDKSVLTHILKNFAADRLKTQIADMIHVGSMDFMADYDTGPTVHFLQESADRVLKDSGKGLIASAMKYNNSSITKIATTRHRYICSLASMGSDG